MFGSGAGHILDSIGRIKWDREHLLKQNGKKAESDEGFIYFGSQVEMKYREGNAAERQEIRNKIKADLKRQRRIEIGMLVLSIVLFLVAFGWFTRNFI